MKKYLSREKRKDMKLMKEYIQQYGVAIGDKILKVDSFLNHQIDPYLMMEVGKEFKARFEGKEITKILTIEASGIAVGITTAFAFQVPMVFAKKNKPSTMSESYNTTVFSFTKNKEYNITVAKEFIQKGDKILIIDDFLALGNAILGLKNLCEQAGAEVVGVGIAIEKGFQEGGKILREKGLHVESLAIIDSLQGGNIITR